MGSRSNFFWEYHDLVFTNYSTGNTGGYSESNLLKFANAMEMDQTVFNDCFSSEEKSDFLAQIRLDASSVGVTGTPSFLVNSKLMPGNVPFEALSAEIEAVLVE